MEIIVNKRIDYKQYARKNRLLRDNHVNRAGLFRWAVDLTIVKLATSGRVSLEELELSGISYDDALKNVSRSIEMLRDSEQQSCSSSKLKECE